MAKKKVRVKTAVKKALPKKVTKKKGESKESATPKKASPANVRRKLKITIKNRSEETIWGKVGKGDDGEGQTGWFDIKKGGSCTWERVPTLKLKTKMKDDDREFFDETYTLWADQTFTVDADLFVTAKPKIN